MLDRVLDAAVLWVCAIATVFCAYKAMIAIWVMQERGDYYTSPFGLEGTAWLFSIATVFCVSIGIWFEIYQLRRTRKRAR